MPELAPLAQSARRGIERSRTGPVLLAIAVLAVAAASDAKPASRSSPTPTTHAGGQHAEHGGVAAARTPRALAAQLEQYLAQHTLLAVRQMRSVLTATPDYRTAADGELQEYTGELAGVVGGAYGDAQGERFERIWEQGIAHFTAYAEAVAGNDAEARQAARANLLADAGAYGAWFAEASKGRVAAGDAAAVLRTHVQQLMDQADAYAARDYDQAYKVERAAYEHMFEAGTSLAKASFPPKGRISEPSSGPMNVIDAACSGVRPNWFCSTRPNAKLYPMNEPKVPM